MIDTIKLMITNYKIEDYSLFKEYKTDYIKEFFANPESKYFKLKTFLKPMKDGVYRPKLFLISHINSYTIYNNALLFIEFSVPKLLFGNNLYEVSESQFEVVVNKLVEKLNDLKITVAKETIQNALSRRLDCSIDIILPQDSNCEDVLEIINETEYPRTKKIFFPGKFVKFHSKTISIIFYDKLEEMKVHGVTAPNFSEILSMSEHRILRIEIQIKRVYGINTKLANNILGLPNGTKLRFKDVYREDVFKKVFEYVLKELYKKLPNIIVDGKEDEQLKKIYGNKTDEIARRILILKYQKDCGSYKEGLKKAIELYGEKFVEKNKCILVDNENINKILFEDVLGKIEDYTPLFNTS